MEPPPSSPPQSPSPGAPPDVAAARAELQQTYLALRHAGRPDAAWCVAHAGVYLLGAHCPDEVREFAARYAQPRPRRARTPLDEAAWIKRLHHSDDDPIVGKAFALVLPAVRAVRARPVADFGVSVSEAVGPENSSVALVRALGAAAFALGVPMPLVFLRPQQPGGLAAVPSEPIATVAGAGALSGRSPAELTFLAGQHMARYRADRYLRTLVGADAGGLAALFLAALRAGDGDVELPDAIRTLPNQLRKHLDPIGLEGLRKLTRVFLAQGWRADIPRWLAGSERTALRAGLLLCGDLHAAREVIAQLPGVPADAMADLTAFAMSEDYFALRQASGIALWADDAAATGPEPPEPRPAAPSIMPPASPAALLWPPPARATEAPRPSTTPSAPSIPAIPLAPRAPSFEAPDERAPRTAAPETAPLPAEPPAAPPTAMVVTAAQPAPGGDLAAQFDALVAVGRLDRAFAVAQVWSRRAGDTLPQRARTLMVTERGRALAPPSGALHEADWQEWLSDPAEHTPVGRLIAVLAPALRATQPRTPQDYGWDPEAAFHHTPAARALHQCAAALGVEAPLVFALEDHPGLFVRPPCEPPVTLAAEALAVTIDPVELRFLAARHAAYLRPALHPRVLAPTAPALLDLVRAVVSAAASGAIASDVDPRRARTVERVLQPVDGAPAAAREIARSLSGYPGLDDDVLRWCEGAERAALRAAFVCAPDLDGAARALERDANGAASISAVDALALLEGFAVGESYAAARARLGYHPAG